MIKRRIVTAAMTLFLMTASAAMAQQNTTQGPGGPAQGEGDHRGPPPNVQQAIQILDQVKQGAPDDKAKLIDQAEDLLKQPPPHRRDGQRPPGGQPPQGNQMGGPSGGAPQDGAPPAQP